MQTLDYIRSLPDVYSKASVFVLLTSDMVELKASDGVTFGCAGGNNWKLLSLESDTVERFREGISYVLESLDIHSATGKTLDLYGEMLGKYRGNASDDQYRYMILGKISQNLCKGDYNSIVEQLARTFNCDRSDFSLVESEESCAVTMANFPMDILLSANLTTAQVNEIISALLPAGVRLVPFEMSGTFTFGNEDDYDEAAGFADDEQTIGGWFGALSSDT